MMTTTFPSRPNTAKQVAVDAFDAMSVEEKDFLSGIAETVIAMHGAKEDARQWLDAQLLDNDETLALWSLLESNIRAYLKK